MNLLEKQISKELQTNVGQVGGGLISTIIGITVAVIVIVAVAIPVTDDVITDANLTGTTATIVELIPLFFALAGLVTVTLLLVFR